MEFFDTGVPVKSSCKNMAMKVEYGLLNDIIAKSLTAKAGSFDRLPTGYYHRKIHRLNLSAKVKRCRIHLSKRHRFAIANFKYHRLVVLLLTADCDDITAYVIITDPSTDSADVIFA
ncbi:Tau class glutathione S-transferase [Dorcoceras hygrometricum]|uniref:Tau class glutathione S-transferase n=1 Tax=Dorcoceras hygrometricum TaxID=472368 RepID=A0A2Z7BBL6_9LAMI|nr:Tau class glutathione S-transferase [Dorcoceras hygrometricum]